MQIQAEAKAKPKRKPFVFSLNAGLIEMSPDFISPLPDTFWLGKDSDGVARCEKATVLSDDPEIKKYPVPAA